MSWSVVASRAPRRMTAAAAAASVAGTLLVSAPQTASAEPGDVLVSRHDKVGDVRLTRRKGIGVRARRSIDIRWARVTQVKPRAYRFTVKLRRVAGPRSRFDQMISFYARPKSQPSSWRNYAVVQFAHRRRYGMAAGAAYDGRTGASCTIERAQRRPKKRTLSVLVPLRCMPYHGWVVDVTATTGQFRTDMPAYSQDKRRLGRLWYP